MDAIDLFLAGLQLYFITMNWTVERGKLLLQCANRGDQRLLPLPGDARVLHRAQPALPRAAGVAAFGHLLQLVRCSASWVLGHTARGAHRSAGGKQIRAHRPFVHPTHFIWREAPRCTLIYYHTMEFTSETPPQGLGAYFGVEGPLPARRRAGHPQGYGR